MTLRRWLFLVGLLSIVACGTRQKGAVALSGQKITIDDQTLRTGGSDTVRFGRMHAGEIAVLPLVFENKSGQPIAILGYDRTCGCTTLDYEHQPLKANEERAAKLTFDARGAHGWQLKLIKIRLAGAQEQHRIYVEADVE